MRTTLMRVKSLEDKVPLKWRKSLALKQEVSVAKQSTGIRGCQSEALALISCLKKYEYDNSFCSKEVEVFNQCCTRYTNAARIAQEHSKLEKPVPGAKLTSRQTSYMLRKYPVV